MHLALLTVRERASPPLVRSWLNWQHDHFPSLLTSATLGRDWFVQMSAAAARQNISIQRCMAYSRHVLQSVESGSITQVRGSGDYRAGNTLWAPLGVTGLFAQAPAAMGAEGLITQEELPAEPD